MCSTIVAGLERRNLDECYFRRLSNCSIADVPRQRVREYDARRQQHSVKVSHMMLYNSDCSPVSVHAPCMKQSPVRHHAGCMP